MAQPKKVLTLTSLVIITVTSVDSIRNLPLSSIFGPALIAFFLLAGIFYFIPAALVSAELATTWPERGGVYVWVKNAFGKPYGFLAVWFQWVNNLIWYPTILSFIAASFAYLISPKLAENPYYLVGMILLVFWGLTFLNIKGIQASVRFTTFCGIIGLVIPMLGIIALGFAWVFSGKPMVIHFDLPELVPNFSDPGLLVAMTGILLCLSGIEISTVHALEVKNPQRDYPKALILSAVVILSTLILGSLSIAIIVPHDKISLVSGFMQAISAFLEGDNIAWLTPVVGLMLAIGALGGLNNWIIAPSKGLIAALEDNDIAPMLQQENEHNVPVALLMFQAVIVSLMSTLFIIMPTINSSYWVMTIMASQLYMSMYVIMFAAAIYLRFAKPDLERPFMVPGGTKGMCLIGGMGIVACVLTILIGFYPPNNVDMGGNPKLFDLGLLIGLIAMTGMPVFFFRKRKAELAAA